MTTQHLPGTDAARHGTGDADLTIMLAAHNAFRRDLTRLARASASASANLSDPIRRQRVGAGWELFKRQLHMHHTAEDQIVWPVLRLRLARSDAAQSVLDAMEEEHSRIDPLLAAVDAAFGRGHEPGQDRLPDTIDTLATTMTSHLSHEERDGLPLISQALTASEWKAAGRKIARKNGPSAASEMFAWILDGTAPEPAAATLRQLPPPLRLLYRARWKPRYDKTPRW